MATDSGTTTNTLVNTGSAFFVILLFDPFFVCNFFPVQDGNANIHLHSLCPSEGPAPETGSLLCLYASPFLTLLSSLNLKGAPCSIGLYITLYFHLYYIKSGGLEGNCDPLWLKKMYHYMPN